MKKTVFAVVLAMGGVVEFSQPVYATDCPITLTQMWAGDNGVLVTYSNGGNATMASSDVNFKQVFAALTASMIAAKLNVTVRIAGTDCTATGQTLQGVWLTPQ